MGSCAVETRRGYWQGRRACILRNDLVELTHLTSGGQIPDFHFLGATAVNPFWLPRWKSRDPALFRPERDEAVFGPAAVGKTLSGIAGHSLCLGVFGMPSDEEIADGAVLHGEAGVRAWAASLHPNRREGYLRFSVRLPASGLVFRRELSLRLGESVVRVRESVHNLLGADQFIQWQQHAVLGPPFLQPDRCTITLPGARAITDPGDYEGHPTLASDAEFTWPHAPGIDGVPIDLQHPCRKAGRGFVAGVQIDPGRELAFVCAVNHVHRLAIGYVFRRSQFPWVTLWEENCARTAPPWQGREQARGFEFGVSPLPLGRAETARRGDVFETPTLLRLPARGSATAAWAMFLCRLHRGVRRVTDIVSQPNHLRLVTGGREAVTLSASSIADFLAAPSTLASPAASSPTPPRSNVRRS